MSDAKTDEMKALLQDWANRMARPVEWQSDGEKGILFPNDGGKDFRNPDNSTEFKDEFPDRAWMMKKWMKEYRAEPPAGSTSGPEEYGEIPADIASKYDECARRPPCRDVSRRSFELGLAQGQVRPLRDF